MLLGRWNQGGVATFRDEDGSKMIVDCGKMLVDVELPDKSDAILQYAQAAKVSVVELRDGVLLQIRQKPRAKPDDPQDYSAVPPPCDLEIVRRVRQGEGWGWDTKKIASPGEIQSYLFSPDRKHLLLEYAVDRSEITHLMLINDQGKIVANLKRQAPPGRPVPPPPTRAPAEEAPAPPAPSIDPKS